MHGRTGYSPPGPWSLRGETENQNCQRKPLQETAQGCWWCAGRLDRRQSLGSPTSHLPLPPPPNLTLFLGPGLLLKLPFKESVLSSPTPSCIPESPLHCQDDITYSVTPPHCLKPDRPAISTFRRQQEVGKRTQESDILLLQSGSATCQPVTAGKLSVTASKLPLWASIPHL